MYRIHALGAIVFTAVALDPAPVAKGRAPRDVVRIAINDNRVPGGTLKDGVGERDNRGARQRRADVARHRRSAIRLEAREGEWHPDRDSDPGVTVLAFGEEGKPLQIPGPMIRVTEGTEVRAFVRNGTGAGTLTMHGLYPRGTAAPST